MPDAHRTLVKSPPELWAEISDPASLARHLGEFGEIRITRTEPETIVAWEGDRVRGTVELEPAGWGTKVKLTAEIDEDAPVAVVAEPEPVVAEPEPVAVEPEPEPVAVVPEPEPEPEAEAEAEEPVAEQPRKRSWFSFLRRRRAAEPVAEPEPVAVEPEPEPVAVVAEPVAVATEPEPVAVVPEPAPEPEPAPVPAADRDPEALLVGVLDALGSAHHRPFSRG